MLKRVIFIFLGLALLTVSCSAAERESELLSSAKSLLLQAQEFDKSPALAEAIRSIDGAQLRASAKPKEDAGDFSLFFFLAPLLAGCVALLFMRKGDAPSKSQSNREEIVANLKHLVMDPSVPDEVIMEMRAKARRLR